MRKKLSNLLTAVFCLAMVGCMSNNAVTEMRYPQIESSAVTVRHYVPRLISSDDYGSDIISPRRERVVKYRSPMPETIISRDNDMEQTKQFWNICIIEDDEVNAECGVQSAELKNNAQFIMHNEELSHHSESSPEPSRKASEESCKMSETEKSKNDEQLAMSNEASSSPAVEDGDARHASAKDGGVQSPQGHIGDAMSGVTTANGSESHRQGAGGEVSSKKTPAPTKKETAFVPVRKIDEDSLDMTNLKNLKVKEMPQQEQAGITDSQLTLSMAGDQWVMKKMLPAYLELKDRKSTDKQTIFTFDVKAPGEVNLVFVRTTKNEIIRQPYKIFIQESPSKNTKSKSETAAKPGAAEAEYKAGMAAKRQAKTDEARKHFTAALSDPDNAYYADALTELIGLYKNDNDTAGAAKAYNQYATADARQSDDKLGILDYDLLVMKGDYKGAITGYRKFMQDFPESNLTDKALYYLAYSLENYKVNPDYREAYRIYNIIIKNYPESKYHKPSQNRSLYLERHYLKIN